MVPGSTLIYGSSLTIAILRPRASSIAPSEAEARPLPREETTPPVTNTNLVMLGHRRFSEQPNRAANPSGPESLADVREKKIIRREIRLADCLAVNNQHATGARSHA